MNGHIYDVVVYTVHNTVTYACSLHTHSHKYDPICENPAFCESIQVMFLVPQVKNCECPVFVIFMSRNFSTKP